MHEGKIRMLWVMRRAENHPDFPARIFTSTPLTPPVQATPHHRCLLPPTITASHSACACPLRLASRGAKGRSVNSHTYYPTRSFSLLGNFRPRCDCCPAIVSNQMTSAVYFGH